MQSRAAHAGADLAHHRPSAWQFAPSAEILREMVSRDVAAQRGLAQILAPLVTHNRTKSGSLIDTVDAFVEHDLSIARTAAAMRVHRHTVDYRIRRAEQILGRSIRKGTDRVVIELALLARRSDAARGS